MNTPRNYGYLIIIISSLIFLNIGVGRWLEYRETESIKSNRFNSHQGEALETRIKRLEDEQSAKTQIIYVQEATIEAGNSEIEVEGKNE